MQFHVAGGHLGKTFIVDLAAKIVLGPLLNDTLQCPGSGLCLFTLIVA